MPFHGAKTYSSWGLHCTSLGFYCSYTIFIFYWEEWPVQSELELCSLIGLLWLSDFIYEEQNSVHHLEDTQVQDSCRQAKRLKE